MKRKITTGVLILTVLATGINSDPAQATEQATDTPPVPGQISVAHSCPNYTISRNGTMRVLVGEFQTLTCDISPPQKLDVVMFPRKLNGKSPKTRCDHSGGHFHKHRDGTLRCNGIDY